MPLRKSIFVCGALALACALPGHAPAAAAPPRSGTPPSPVSLAQGWEFRLDPGDAGLRSAWPRGGPVAGWQPVSVPHVFDPQPSDASFGGAVGWYRLRFTAPAQPAGFGWALRFEQSRRLTHVWLNGRSIGGSRDPYTPFVLPARGLRPNAANVLVVRVDSRKGAEPREGWWNWGGLTRPVSLVPLGPVSIANPGLLPQLHCTRASVCTGGVLFDGWVHNNTAGPADPTISVTLTPPGGGPSVQASHAVGTLARRGQRHVRFAVPLTGAVRTWSPGDPQLYAAKVEAISAGAMTELDPLRIGMRAVTVHAGALYLNGAPIQLHGASIQEDVPGRGPAIGPADDDQIVAQLRSLHANATRSQYPLNEALLARLDAAGIMVWSQAPIYHRDELLHTPGQRAGALGTLRGSVLATRNHPSVITESVANELSPTPDSVPGTRRYLLAAAGVARAVDPGVPVSLDILSYPGFPAQRTYDAFDLLGINNYFGWYTGKPGHSTASIADLEPYLRAAHARYPRQALVMTEFGAEADTQGPASVKQTYAFQTDYIRRTLGIVDRLPFMSGALYWTLREFAVKPHWDGGAHRRDVPRTAIHHKGLIAYDGTAKPAFAATAALFANEPLLAPLATASRHPTHSSLGSGGWLLLLLILPCGLIVLTVLRRRARPRARRRSGRAGGAAPSDDRAAPAATD